MAEINKLDFKLLRAADLGPDLNTQITRLIMQSLHADFDNVPLELIESYALSLHSDRINPNHAADETRIRPHQGFRNMHHVVAFKDGELIAHLPIGQYASSSLAAFIPKKLSKLQSVVAYAETKLGLYTPLGELTNTRCAYVGHCALSERARDMIGETRLDQGTVIDGLLAIATDNTPANPLVELPLPLRAYPYKEEEVWRRGLAGAGYKPLPELDLGDLHIFGPQGPSVYVEAWGAEFLSDVWIPLYAQQGIPALLIETSILTNLTSTI